MELLGPPGPGLPHVERVERTVPSRQDVEDVLWDRLMELGVPGQFAWAWSADLADVLLDRLGLIGGREYGTMMAISQQTGRLTNLLCGCIWDDTAMQFAWICDQHRLGLEP